MTAARRNRWEVAGRFSAALVLGYALTNSAAILIGFLLPVAKETAVLGATVGGFALWTAIVVWVFAVKSWRVVWVGLLVGIVVTTSGSWILYLLEAGA